MTEQRTHDLRIGDILLLKYKGTDPMKLLHSITAALNYLVMWWCNKPINEKKMVDELHPLFLFLINELDESGFYHAAIVVQPGDATDEKFVFEIGPEGFNTGTTVDQYLEKLGDYYAVFRYVNDGHILGDPGLPAEPVNDTAVATANSKTPYSLSTLALLAVLCVYRKGEGPAATALLDIIVEWFGEGVEKLINQTDLEVMMREVVRAVLTGLEEPHTMVCTQFVAHSFNAADDKGRYALSRQRRPSNMAPRRAPGMASIRPTEKDFQEIERLLTRVSKLDIQGRDVSALKSLSPRAEELYTPSDLAFSINTKPVKQ